MKILIGLILVFGFSSVNANAICGLNWCDGKADTIFESFKTTTSTYVQYKLPLSLANYLTSCPSIYSTFNGWVKLHHGNRNFMALFPKLEQALLTGQSVRVNFIGTYCDISSIEVRIN